MPQMKVWPFMARRMVEESHGVKPLLVLPAAQAPAKRQALQGHNSKAASKAARTAAATRIEAATETNRSSSCGG
jgi:hypothetical protein